MTLGDSLEKLLSAFLSMLRSLLLLLLEIATIAVNLLRTMFDALRSVAIVLVRCGVVCLAVLSGLWSGVTLHAAYGGDLPALLPALAVGGLPAVYGIFRLNDVWSGLVFAAVVTASAGLIVQSLPLQARWVLAGAVRGAAILHLISMTIYTPQEKSHHEMEQAGENRDDLGLGGHSSSHDLLGIEEL